MDRKMPWLCQGQAMSALVSATRAGCCSEHSTTIPSVPHCPCCCFGSGTPKQCTGLGELPVRARDLAIWCGAGKGGYNRTDIGRAAPAGPQGVEWSSILWETPITILTCIPSKSVQVQAHRCLVTLPVLLALGTVFPSPFIPLSEGSPKFPSSNTGKAEV